MIDFFLLDFFKQKPQLSLEVPNSLSYKREIERDLGHIFRTPYFNIGAREEEMDKLVDTLTVREDSDVIYIHISPWILDTLFCILLFFLHAYELQRTRWVFGTHQR